MRKLNGYENWVVHIAVENFVKQSEKEIKDAEIEGKHLIYASGYFRMVADELLEKIDCFTKKDKKRKK